MFKTLKPLLDEAIESSQLFPHAPELKDWVDATLVAAIDATEEAMGLTLAQDTIQSAGLA